MTSLRRTVTAAGIYAGLLWAPLAVLAFYGHDAWDETSRSAHHWYFAVSVGAGVVACGRELLDGERRLPVLLAWAAAAALVAAVLLPTVAWVALLLAG